MSGRRELYPPQERPRARPGYHRCRRCNGTGREPADQNLTCAALCENGEMPHTRDPERRRKDPKKR